MAVKTRKIKKADAVDNDNAGAKINISLDGKTHDRLRFQALLKGVSATALARELLVKAVNKGWQDNSVEIQLMLANLGDK